MLEAMTLGREDPSATVLSTDTDLSEMIDQPITNTRVDAPASAAAMPPPPAGKMMKSPEGSSNLWFGRGQGQASGTNRHFYANPSGFAGSGAGGGRSRSGRGFRESGSSIEGTLGLIGDVGRDEMFGSSGEPLDDADEQVELLSEEQIGHLVRVLDRPLFRLAVRSLLLEKDPTLNIKLVAEERYLDDEGLVLVAIKLDEVDSDRIEALKKLGLQILAINEETDVVVGLTSDRVLLDIGLLDDVLRVVPTEMKEAPVK